MVILRALFSVYKAELVAGGLVSQIPNSYAAVAATSVHPSFRAQVEQTVHLKFWNTKAAEASKVGMKTVWSLLGGILPTKNGMEKGVACLGHPGLLLRVPLAASETKLQGYVHCVCHFLSVRVASQRRQQ